MKVSVAKDSAALNRRAADIVQGYLCSVSRPALGLATGGSVEGLYRELVERFTGGQVRFAGVGGYLLDEYVGLGLRHPQRYSNVIRTQLVDMVDFEADNLHSPDGDASDLEKECARYDQLITDAQIGLQILGIGRNGHLAFNEPGSPFDSRTRVAPLAESTRADNARHFCEAELVPRYAITQGLATIGQAGHLLVVATGSAKAEAVRAALEGPITRAAPATVIQRHPRVTVLLDPPAAGLTRFAQLGREDLQPPVGA